MAVDASADTGSAGASFDSERLDAYRVALEFQRLLPRILPRRGHSNLRDQLERASTSVVLNVRGLLSEALHRQGRGLLLRLVQMLTRLVQKPQAELRP